MNKDFRFRKLSRRHKKIYVIHHMIIIGLLIGAAFLAWKLGGVKLPTRVAKLSAGAAFILSATVLLFAIRNRLETLFKVRSAGFMILWIISLGIRYIVDVMIWMSGLLLIVMLLDDIIMTSYWNSVWYNHYE